MTTYLFYEWTSIHLAHIISGDTAYEAYKKLKALYPINRGLLVESNQAHHMGTYEEGSYFNPPV